MIRSIKKSRQIISIFFTLLISLQIFAPVASYALTGGPTQPEVQGFAPATATDMVDLFSGDFSYNIPLFELPGPSGGYPFNLSYQSGITTDQEASWVGLGFSLNPGAITRQMRGLPDEFNGDKVTTTMAVKPSVTRGLSGGVNAEIFGGDLAIGIGYSVSQNSYKGYSYSIDGSLGYQKTSSTTGMTDGIGIDFSLGNDGISLSPSLNLSGKVGNIGLQAGYHSKEGLQTISADAGFVNSKKLKSKEVAQTFSLSHPGYTPQVGMPMVNVNLSAKLKLQATWWGIAPGAYVSGFYNRQKLKNFKKPIQTPAYGYMNYQNSEDASDLLDFNREKDGMVMKESPNLGIPSLTYDIYTVSGQGVSAMYRPFRNDYGVISDPYTKSTSVGAGIGVDIGPTASRLGVNLSLNYSESHSGPWSGKTNLSAGFKKGEVNSLYEPWSFRVHGESTPKKRIDLTNIGGNEPVSVKLTKNGDKSVSAENELVRKKTSVFTNPTPSPERKPRGQVIQTYSQGQLVNGASTVFPIFNNFSIPNYTRTNDVLTNHHVGAISVLTTDGLRYNYGLPIYNNKQVEVSFSTATNLPASGLVTVTQDGISGLPTLPPVSASTDEFLKKTEMPKYVHAHMLTSIIGPDYVDLGNDGVTADDLGYWVKFSYKKTHSNYKWRDPYAQAHYVEGWQSDPSDNKGSYTYGEKDMWLLEYAETKSHRARFISSPGRTDGLEAFGEFAASGQKGTNAPLKLDEVILESKAIGGTTQLKKIKFTYSSTPLCSGILNGSNGKLTLQNVTFTYGSSTKGELNPYTFKYGATAADNPPYQINAVDRWGTYKPVGSNPRTNLDFPYTAQDPSSKTAVDSYASAWSLKEIQTPSGAKIQVDYETDDYAYVQQRQAMQMTEVVANLPADMGSTTFPLDNSSDNVGRVTFKLQEPIPVASVGAGPTSNYIKPYLDLQRNRVFFKVKMALHKTTDNLNEIISGYATINTNETKMYLAKSSPDATSYDLGVFHLAPEEGYHPFSTKTYQHIRTNQPDMAYTKPATSRGTDVAEGNTDGMVKQMKALGSIGESLRSMMQGFSVYCFKQNWGVNAFKGESFVRLNTVDKVKYGGGLRVKQITMKDQWKETAASPADGSEGIYGQYYEYTMTENGKTISSGVAANEPFIGGEENALRYAKEYSQSIPLRADNNLFFEFPVNESYYPGASVGYRKVTVYSLPAAQLAKKTPSNLGLSTGALFPDNAGTANITFGTSGVTVHEFYTAKDFPVIANETEKVNETFKLSLPVPFLGHISISRLTASQGYTIISNDMHGKPKQISSYRQDPLGNTEEKPISWTRYNYMKKDTVYDTYSASVLKSFFYDNGNNMLSSLSASDARLSTEKDKIYSIGEEVDFFFDMREHEDASWSGGGNLNTDIVWVPIIFAPVPIPIPSAWPTIGKTQNLLRTAVTNKIIFRSGILQSVEAYDGGSRVITENKLWDKMTGTPILTSVNNDYDAPVFTLNTPAYTQYKGMGAAYQNTGFQFTISSVQQDPYYTDRYRFYTVASNEAVLYEGDEFILFEDDAMDKPIGRAIYLHKDQGDRMFFCDKPLSLQKYTAVIVRSGYRNQLSVSAGSITALVDPSIKGVEKLHPAKPVTILK